MRITLNLASRPYTNYAPMLRRLRIAMAALAMAAIAMATGLGSVRHQASETRARARDFDAQLTTLQREQNSYRQLMAQPENKLLLAESATLNKLFDEKAFSWTLAMEDLETVLPAGVQVSTLEPVRDKEGKITLHMMVAGPRDRAVELVRNLERSHRFLLPRIVGESAESGDRPGQALAPVSASSRVNFDLLADYNPVTEEEAAQILRQRKSTLAAETKPSAPSANRTTAAPRTTGGAR